MPVGGREVVREYRHGIRSGSRGIYEYRACAIEHNDPTTGGRELVNQARRRRKRSSLIDILRKRAAGVLGIRLKCCVECLLELSTKHEEDRAPEGDKSNCQEACVDEGEARPDRQTAS
jgi:hypothetical protein